MKECNFPFLAAWNDLFKNLPADLVPVSLPCHFLPRRAWQDRPFGRCFLGKRGRFFSDSPAAVFNFRQIAPDQEAVIERARCLQRFQLGPLMKPSFQFRGRDVRNSPPVAASSGGRWWDANVGLHLQSFKYTVLCKCDAQVCNFKQR